uniref:Secreted protein n=1 Tax=Mesocestoides corti TaxID=53468 RepID=A0A5K3EQI4_MESCO
MLRWSVRWRTETRLSVGTTLAQRCALGLGRGALPSGTTPSPLKSHQRMVFAVVVSSRCTHVRGGRGGDRHGCWGAGLARLTSPARCAGLSRDRKLWVHDFASQLTMPQVRGESLQSDHQSYVQ